MMEDCLGMLLEEWERVKLCANSVSLAVFFPVVGCIACVQVLNGVAESLKEEVGRLLASPDIL